MVALPGPRDKIHVSATGGGRPRWRRDGKELFYMMGGQIMAAELTLKDPNIQIGRTQALFGGLPSMSFDATPDGQRFLALTASEQSGSEPLRLMQNWTARLKR